MVGAMKRRLEALETRTFGGFAPWVRIIQHEGQSEDEATAAYEAEHGPIGKRYGFAGLAADIRLACHGLDKHDNDFVIGLLGPDLFPLSAVVQEMRKTEQTSQFLDSLGPFFIGKVAWQSPKTL